MATGAAADGLFWSMYEGCLSGYDNCIERRPYHRNCGCELHKSRQHCTHKLPKSNNVSYPIRRAWSEGNLILAMASSPHSSLSSSPSPPPPPPPPAPAPRPPQPSPSLSNLDL